MNQNPEVKKIVREKIYPKYENLIGEIHESRRDIPIWLKHCDKQTAEELRNLCSSYSQLSETEREQQFPYFFWLPTNQEKYTEKPQECKNFGKDFQEFLSGLESIVIGKEDDNRERERERERAKMLQMWQRP